MDNILKVIINSYSRNIKHRTFVLLSELLRTVIVTTIGSNDLHRVHER